MATIHDIAKEAGVSVTTVSKALNNYKDVSESTRVRVKEIADKLNYYPNANAKGLITKKNWLVGILFSETLNIGLEHPFFSGVIEGFKNEMEIKGYDTIFITKTIGGVKTDYIKHCKYRNIDGVFVLTFAEWDDDLQSLLECDIPTINIDVIYDDIPTVISENKNGITMAMDYLVNLGHTKIAHIAGTLDTYAGVERKNAYIEYLNNNNMSVNTDEYIVEAEQYDFESGYKAANILLDQVSDVPTAITVGSDMIAIGVMDALKDKGYKVPDDISVIGFDNINVAQYVYPKLTTVNQKTRLMGKTAAQKMLNILNDIEVDQVSEIPVDLVVRDSCSKVK